MDEALYSVEQIRATEQAQAALLAPGALMQRAGQAAANAALALLAGGSGPVLVLAGPGNNGGDALEVAANLALAGVDVALVHLAGAAPVSPETAHALARARASDSRFIDWRSEPAQRWQLIVDGLFGIGLARPLAGDARELVLHFAAAACPVLALDVPSGLDADTGAVVGPDGVAIIASHTITFIGDKPGLHTYAGRDHAGMVEVADLGIDPAALPEPVAVLNRAALFNTRLKKRAHSSHKGSFGDVTVIGGAAGMAGAAVLAARAALLCGAGRVLVAAPDNSAARMQYDAAHPELMFRDGATHDWGDSALVAGPGMGGSIDAMRLLVKALDSAAPLVLDADALNLVAASPDLQAHLVRRSGPTILTPHPLEAGRLLGSGAQAVQADRLTAARTLAQRLHAVVILKGSGTVLAHFDGRCAINPTGNPGLASAGTGDVLAGMCGALLAQQWPAWEAALGAVWMHGAAADYLVAQGIGPIGLCASELPAAARTILNQLVSATNSR